MASQAGRATRLHDTAPRADRPGARHAAHIRGLNIERVLDVVMDSSVPFTRNELMKATGLSAPTVGNLTTHLIRAGVVTDRGAGPSSGGRRPSFMEFNPRHGYVGGIDLGPTRTRLAVADLRGERLSERIIPTPRLEPSALLAKLAEAFRGAMHEADAPMDRLLAVAAGAPGAVDCDTGTVAFAPNLQGWSRVPMRDILEKALGAPVSVENDVNLAVLGEHWRGAARGHDTCAFIFVGTGIGAGILIDGELHRGRNFLAGEIAVMCMGAEYAEQDFGSRGCFESLAGLEALAGRWPNGAKGDPAQWMAKLFAASRNGDPQARKAIEDTARLIGIAVANVDAVVDPSLIILGGALFVEADPLFEEVRRVVLRIARSPLEIALSALGKDAPLSGTLLVAGMEARRRVRQRLREARFAS
jgi:predicted NBD/HSP70 family sugar kinase